MFELFKNEKSLNGKNRIRYKMNEDTITCCKKIFSLSDYTIKNVIVTISGEEMKPFVTKCIKSFQEYEKIKNQKEILSCEFIGFYTEKETRICIDNELSVLTLVTEESVAKCIIKNLSI